MARDYPILEFDPARTAVIEPVAAGTLAIPPRGIICAFGEVLARVRRGGHLRILGELRSDFEYGPHPIYELSIGDRRLAVIHQGVGAPLAAAFLEELIALGCRTLLACGGAGVLDPAIAVGQVVIPAVAVRDEGTSYHYLPPGREAAASPHGIAALARTLDAHAVSYTVGKTWTTDAFYRETPDKVHRRRAEGCLTVEMEAAALFAVAHFRGATLAQVLYGGGDSSGTAWDDRRWETHAIRERLFWLAAEACLDL